jgi:hypothetical protein
MPNSFEYILAVSNVDIRGFENSVMTGDPVSCLHEIIATKCQGMPVPTCLAGFRDNRI